MNILHFGNVANVSYLLAYGLEKYCNCKAYLIMSQRLPFDYKVFYGFKSGSGNPYNVRILWASGNLFSDVNAISRQIFKKQIDITHFHTGGAMVLNFLVKMFKCKIVRHFHGSDIRQMSKTMRSFLGFVGERKVLVSTPDLFRYLWSKAGFHAEWLSNPIDPMICETSKRREDENIVFLPTRHDENTKKTSVAFRAWTFLRKLNPTVRMKTIMWGRDFPRLYNRFRSDKRIIWLPVMTRQEYIEQLRTSSIVWGQFILGILSMIELEAMAAGKPIITCSKWHMRYFPPPPLFSYCSPQSIAHITHTYLEDESARKDLGASLRKWCLANHSLEAVSRRLYDIYKEIV